MGSVRYDEYTEQIVIGSNAISHCHQQRSSCSSSSISIKMEQQYRAESIAISTQIREQRIQSGAVHINSVHAQCRNMDTDRIALPLWRCVVCKWFNIAPSSRCVSCSTERTPSTPITRRSDSFRLEPAECIQ